MSTIFGNLCCMFRRCLFSVLSIGPIPDHIAFIMDGNRRYAKRTQISTGHRVGFSALISVLRYCYEIGVKYVTIYAFSIDNFKRKPEEVQSTMDLMKEKIDELLEEHSIVNKYGIRMNFWGNLNLLNDAVRLSVEKAMRNTSNNTGPVLSVCVAYTSTNEIAHAIEKSCCQKTEMMKRMHANGFENGVVEKNTQTMVTVVDLEMHLFSNDCPDPDIIIRTSGETRLSNFLLWQSSFSHLQNPTPLWPEFSLRHLVWAILSYQRAYPYLQNRSKKML
ncbi:Dehydrodolichyl diphosphate synthase 6 [Platanthera guangdongensis]|uniref:Alkyl transferase n=1 Tax=Platanthera guangdongensis TaxID=2320717 RepID=A0ABR2MDI1_9ASPA